MESSLLLASPINARNGAPYAQWLPALEEERQRIHEETEASLSRSSIEPGASPTQSAGSGAARHGRFFRHALHRRRLYLRIADDLSHLADAHYFYRFMMWCHDHQLFVHPSVRVHRRRSSYRDHAFIVAEDVPRLTPLLAIPESLVIGFKNPDGSDADGSDGRNALHDAAREKEFHKQNVGESSNADICEFFFASLGMIVSDLVAARNSALTDKRSLFANLLGKMQTIQNAPYFGDDVIFDAKETCLADILLQMIRNYVNGGPLANKLPQDEVRWAVSVCLSHSTPLSIGTKNSIGIIPIVHLFPHGGAETNSFVVARSGRAHGAESMAAFFAETTGYDFSLAHGGRWIYVVPARDLAAGEEIRLQAMAPACARDSEAEQMWRLSCGSVPESFMSSVEMMRTQISLQSEITKRGEEIRKR